MKSRTTSAHVGLGPLEPALVAAGDGACVTAADGRVVLWNLAAERMLGWPACEVVGRVCSDVFGDQDGDGERLRCHVGSLNGDDDPVESFDVRTRTKAGRAVWLNVSILHLSAAGGSVTVHLFRDVTVHRELLGRLREQLGATAEPAAGTAPDHALSRRELDVLRLLALGLNTRATAERLHVSPATVRNHVQNLFAKLGVHSRLEAVAHARRQRLL